MNGLTVPTDNPVSAASNPLIEHSVSKNTKRVYAGCLARFFNWLEDRPVNDESVAEYVLKLFAEGKSHATAAQSVAAIRFRTRTAGMKNVVGPRAEQALIGFRREAKFRGRGQADGLRWEQTDTIVELAAQNGLVGVRDAAIIAVASDAMLRISEVAAIQCEDVNVEPDGTGRLVIRTSKTDQVGRGTVMFLGQPTVERLSEWAAGRVSDVRTAIPACHAGRACPGRRRSRPMFSDGLSNSQAEIPGSRHPGEDQRTQSCASGPHSRWRRPAHRWWTCRPPAAGSLHPCRGTTLAANSPRGVRWRS